MNIQRKATVNSRDYNNKNSSNDICPLILYSSSIMNNPTNISTITTSSSFMPQPPSNDNFINYNNIMPHPISLFHPNYSAIVSLDDPLNSNCESSVNVENLQTLLDSLDDPPQLSFLPNNNNNNSFLEKNVRVLEYSLEEQLDSIPNSDHNHIIDETMLKTSGGSIMSIPKMIELDGNKEKTATTSDKQRIKWTQELHDLFLDAIETLGGPEFATPKKILGLMNVEGLSIYHVKSHLQKYRLAKNVPDLKHVKLVSGILEKKGSTSSTELTQTCNSSDGQINSACSENITVTEALRLQIQLQKLLHDQLKAQRELQISIEQNGEILRKLIEKQNNTNKSPKPADDESSPSDFITNESSSSQPSASN